MTPLADLEHGQGIVDSKFLGCVGKAVYCCARAVQ